MKNNTVTAYNGAEFYTDKIFMYADEYIDYELDEKRREDIYNNSSIFMAMILYISDNIDKPDNNDIELLDNIISDFIAIVTTRENKVFIHGDDEINAFNEKLDKFSTKIKLLLNYSGTLDKKIIEDVEYITQLSCDLYSFILQKNYLMRNFATSRKTI